jgi:hypothetical protein
VTLPQCSLAEYPELAAATPASSSGGGTNVGAIAGGVVGGVAGAAGIASLLLLWRRRRRRQQLRERELPFYSGEVRLVVSAHLTPLQAVLPACCGVCLAAFGERAAFPVCDDDGHVL